MYFSRAVSHLWCVGDHNRWLFWLAVKHGSLPLSELALDARIAPSMRHLSEQQYIQYKMMEAASCLCPSGHPKSFARVLISLVHPSRSLGSSLLFPAFLILLQIASFRLGEDAQTRSNVGVAPSTIYSNDILSYIQ